MRTLYEITRQGPRLIQSYGQHVRYLGIGEHLSVYNATPPLWLKVGGKVCRVSVGRVEHPSDWAHSRIMFFENRTATEYHLIDGAPVFYGEDPAVTTIGDEIVLTSVHVAAVRKDDHLLETEIRRGNDVMQLWECRQRIPGKDNRFTPLDHGSRIGVMTRPQNKITDRGKMAYVELDNVDDVCEDSLRTAHIIEFPMANNTWVGGNELHNLEKKGQIGILAHGAFFDDSYAPHGSKTYFIFFAWLDRKTLQIVDLEPLAFREDFPSSDSKTSALCNVAFGTGLVVPTGLTRECPELYAGIGDLTQAFVPIRNPKIVGLYD